MTRFLLEKLNVDLSKLVPSHGEMNILVEAFKDTVCEATSKKDPELLASLCAGIGEVRLRGVCRRLSTPERAEIIQLLLPEVTETSSKAQELISRLCDTAPHLVALQEIFETLGYERFREEPLAKWFGERAALAEAVGDLKGADFLDEEIKTRAEAEVAIDRINDVLRHNASLLESDDRLQHVPMAFNAKLLLVAFDEQRMEVEDPIEFAQAWNERIKIHTATGLGVFDSADLVLSSRELREIRQGLEQFPAYVLTLENVAIGINFRSPPAGREGALGGYEMGRIFLFDTVRDARPGVDFPETGIDPVMYATVHEVSHTAQTVGMMDFQKISRWVRVSNLTFRDPVTNSCHRIRPEAFVPGECVEAESGRYIVSFHVEPETIHFPLGVSIKNPDKADAEAGYLYRDDAKFVNSYAATSPEEDYAESLTAFLLDPKKLLALAPEKHELMNFLYGKISK
jgi:hypothetical protein